MQRFISFLILIFIGHSILAQDQLSQNKVERLYQRGTELIYHSNYGAARQVFTDFLEQASPTDSRRSQAEYYVAFSALNLGHKDGEKLIDNFIENNPSSPKASTAFYDLATFFYKEGSYVKASNYYKKVNFPSLTGDQQNQGHFNWGYSLFTQKKLDEALEQFNFVKRQNTSFTAASNYYAGYIEYTKGIYDEALFDLKKAESTPSYAGVVPYLIANIYYKQKRYDTLIEYATSLKGRNDITNSGEISMLVAESYYYKGDFKKAVDSYQAYFDKNANAETGLYFRAGYANYSVGNIDRGIDLLGKAAASKDTVSYFASYYLGILHLKQGNKPLALNAFDYARQHPTDKNLVQESTFQFGKASYDAGKADQAIAEFEKYLKTYPSGTHTTEIKELLAQAYVNGNNFNKALEYIESLPTRNQYVNQAYQKAAYLKGAELYNKENYVEAIYNFEKSLEFPQDPVYVALAALWNGEAYSASRRFDKAVSNYQKVVSLPSPDPEILLKARYGLGYAHYNLQAYDQALFNFKEFVNKGNKNTPNYSDGLIRLADCYYVTKDYDAAINTYSKVKASGSADLDYVLLQTGVISGIQKRYAEARSNLNQLVKDFPKSQYRDEAMLQRAQLDIEQGNYQGAVDGLSQLIRESANSPNLPIAFMKRGIANFNLKKYSDAANDYAYVINQYGNTPEANSALLPLQEALNMAGRSDEFDTYLEKQRKANPTDQNLEKIDFEAAKNQYNSEQYQKAILSFTKYLSAYPASANRAEVNYLLAESHYRLQQFDKALPIYAELSNDATFTMGNRVVGRIAEIEFKQGHYEKAVPQYHRLEKLASSKKDKYNAWNGLMESFYILTQYDSSDIYARLILEQGNINAAAQNKASLFLGKTAMAKGDYEGAKDEFLNTLNAATDEYGAEAKFLLAQIMYNQKEYKQSYETLLSLNNDFSTYQNWVGKSFLLMADNFIALEDVFQARATLQSLDKFPVQSVKDEAKRKLAELEKREVEKQKAIEADTLEN